MRRACLLSTFARSASFAALLLSAATLAQAQPAGTLVIPQSAALRHGLQRSMMTQLDIDSGRGRVVGAVFSQGTLLVQSNQALLQSVNVETGKTNWMMQLGDLNRSATPPGTNGRHVAGINGSVLYLLDAATGKPIWEQRLGGVPSTGPTLSANYVYVPMLGGVVEAYPLDREAKLEPLTMSGSGTALAPPLVTDESIVWTTEKGSLLVHRIDNHRQRFNFRAEGGMVSSATSRENILFAGSLDGYVYALNELTGAALWRFATGDRVRETPLVVDKAVYVVAERGGLFRVNAESGAEAWYSPGVRRLLAASQAKLYAEDGNGQMVVLDARTGARVDGFPIPVGLSLRIQNHDTDRILLGSPVGMFQAFHEVALTKPVQHRLAIHFPVLRPAGERPVLRRPAAAAAPDGEAAPGAEASVVPPAAGN